MKSKENKEVVSNDDYLSSLSTQALDDMYLILVRQKSKNPIVEDIYKEVLKRKDNPFHKKSSSNIKEEGMRETFSKKKDTLSNKDNVFTKSLDSNDLDLIKGGFKVGTLRKYEDGSGALKIADTGGKGDWKSLTKEEVIAHLNKGKYATSPNSSAVTKQPLPKHLQKIVDDLKEKQKQFGFTIEDVTPAGYGPTDPEITSEIQSLEDTNTNNPFIPIQEVTTEQKIELEEPESEKPKVFTPSKYQQAIFDFITDGKGNAAIDAVAGSGKTTTLLESLKLLPEEIKKEAIFISFSNAIVAELETRVPKGIKCTTLHALGYSAFRKYYPEIIKNRKLNFSQIKDLLKLKDEKIKNLAIQYTEDENIDIYPIKQNIEKLVGLSKANLCETEEEVIHVAERHNVDLIDNKFEPKIVLELLDESFRDRKSMTFDNMIYIAARDKSIIPQKYKFILIDECQDLNKAQQALFLKHLSPDGRFIACGDPRQSIMGFQGADTDSFKKLTEIPNTVILPLSVCYRCGSDIIDLAKSIVPHLEALETAKKGEVKMNSSFTEIKDGGMVLCRVNAPLVKMCLQFLALGKKAYVKGADIAEGIRQIVKKSKVEGFVPLDNFLKKEYDNVVKNTARKMSISIDDATKMPSARNFAEKIIIINLFKENGKIIRNNKEQGIKNCSELIESMDKIFKDESKEGICLSSIHKSKGLEAKEVYIIDKHRMPSPYAKKDWEIEQEENLRYVAFTRAKSKLGFISNWTFGDRKNPGTTLEQMKDTIEEESKVVKGELKLFSHFTDKIKDIINPKVYSDEELKKKLDSKFHLLDILDLNTLF